MKIDRNRRFYVYVIFLPGWMPTPCYVGKGTGRRTSRQKQRRHNSYLDNLYRRYGDLPILKIREHLTERQAFALERRLISCFGRREHGGCLVNLTDGGEGASGHVHTKTTRAKMRRSHLGIRNSPEAIEKTRLGNLGKINSPEARAKMSLAKLGKPSPTHRRNIGLANRGRVVTPETRKRISVALAGRPLSEAHKRSISLTKLGASSHAY